MYGNYQATLDGFQKQYEQLQKLTAQEAPAQQVPTVAGIDGARAYQLGKSSSVALFDTEDDVFYFRQTDANGNEMPMKVGRFKLEDAPKAESDFVTMKDFEALKAELVDLFRDVTKKEANEE